MSNKHKKNRLIFIASIVVISIISLIFIVVNFNNQIVFFYSPSELKSEEILAKQNPKKQIRVGGLVVEKSVKKIDALTTEFMISDLKNELRIIHKGLTPDLFREKQGVVAKGIFDVENNVFLSSELLVKHDEKYMPPEIAKSLK